MNTDETVRLLSELVSEQAGRIEALEAALTGIMRSDQLSAATRQSVVGHLEAAYARQLGGSLNPVALQEFEDTRGVLIGFPSVPPVD